MSSKSTPAKSTSTVATRSSTEVWLVGHPIDRIDEQNQLPTSGMALRRIYHEMKVNKATLPIACGAVADEILSFWEKANIVTTAKATCCRQAEDHSSGACSGLKAQTSAISYSSWIGNRLYTDDK